MKIPTKEETQAVFFSKQYGGTWEHDGKNTWFDDENMRFIVRFGERYSIHDPEIEGGLRRITFTDGLIKETAI